MKTNDLAIECGVKRDHVLDSTEAHPDPARPETPRRHPLRVACCWSHVSPQETVDGSEAEILSEAETVWPHRFRDDTVEEGFQASVVRTRLLMALWMSILLGVSDSVSGIKGLCPPYYGEFTTGWTLPPQFWLANGIFQLTCAAILFKRRQTLLTEYIVTYRISMFVALNSTARFTLYNLMCEYWKEYEDGTSKRADTTVAVLAALLCVPIVMGLAVVPSTAIACSEAVLLASSLVFIKPQDGFIASYLLGSVLCVMIVSISLIQRARQSFAREVVLHRVAQREIETLKLRTNEREEADRVQAQSQAYATVVASTVHDLKTPLAALHSGCSVLGHRQFQDELNGISDVAANEVLAHMHSATRMALGLVDGMSTSALLLSGGEIKPEYKLVQVKELVLSAMACLQLAVSHTSVDYRIEVEDDIPTVLTDAVAVSRNIINLLTNASRHTTKGSIVASVTMVATQAGAKQIEFSVADTGCGGVSQLSHIWEPFVSLAGSSGMGLYVVRKQAEALGGTAGVRENPAPSGGSVFWFRVPCRQETHLPELTLPRELQDILLIDDVPCMIQLSSMDLKRQGYRVEQAHGAKQGLEKMKMATFGLVLCDYNMPEENGAKCTAKLREWEAETGRVPQLIFALTGEYQEEVCEECFSAGMQAVMVKPLNMQEVLIAFQNHYRTST